MVNDLAELIDNYISAKKSRSLCQLSKQSGVSYSTLQRITQGATQSVTQETAINILRVFCTLDQIIEFVEKHYPGSGATFREITKNLRSAAKKEITDLLKDYNTWYACCMAERQIGVSLEELSGMIGKRQAKRALTLLNESVDVEIKNGRYHLCDKEFAVSGNACVILREINHFCKTYDHTKRSEPGHFLSNLVTGWNDKGLALIKESLKEVAIRLANASNDPEYKGDKTAFIGIISGTFGEE